MTGVLSIIEPGTFTQLNAGLLMASLSTIAVTWARPYGELRDNVVAVLSGTLLMLTFTSASLMKSQKLIEDGYEANGLGAVLVAATVVIVVVFIVWAWYSFNDLSRSSNAMASRSIQSNAESTGRSSVKEMYAIELARRDSAFKADNPMHTNEEEGSEKDGRVAKKKKAKPKKEKNQGLYKGFEDEILRRSYEREKKRKLGILADPNFKDEEPPPPPPPLRKLSGLKSG